MVDYGLWIVDCQIADWKITDCGLRIGGLGIGDWGLQITDCRLQIGRLQIADGGLASLLTSAVRIGGLQIQCIADFDGGGLQIDGFNVEVLKSQSLKISIKFTVRSGNMIELTSVAPS